MQKRVLLIFLFLSAFEYSFAATKAPRSFFHWEAHVSAGSGTITQVGDTSKPSLGIFNLGIGLGINIRQFTVGVNSDYHILTQFSEVDATVGNRRGTIVTPASAFLSYNFSAASLYAVIITSSSYDLTNTTVSGEKFSYSKASGFRLGATIASFGNYIPFLFHEKLQFKEKSINGSAATLETPLEFTQTGLGVRYGY